jgi:hypothetical protein
LLGLQADSLAELYHKLSLDLKVIPVRGVAHGVPVVKLNGHVINEDKKK